MLFTYVDTDYQKSYNIVNSILDILWGDIFMLDMYEASKALGIHYNTLRKYRELGLIKYIRMGKSYKFSEEEIERVKREGITLPNMKNSDTEK